MNANYQRLTYTSSLIILATVGSISLPDRQSRAEDSPAAPAESTEHDVDYARDIAPLLTRNCIACHNAKKPEGGLNLESHADLMAGGDSGPAIVRQNQDESILLGRVVSIEDPMPPADNQVGAKALTPEEVALLQAWIVAGAPDSLASAQTSLNWQRIPEGLSPIYALDSSRDGQLLAIGNGNKVQLVRPTGGTSTASSQELIDSNLHLSDGTPLVATHLDLVQSLAFSPDSQLLATGGFRTVKLWRRQTAARTVLSGLASSDGLSASSKLGTKIAVVTQGTGIELIDVASSQSHRFLGSHTQAITALFWLSENTLLSADVAGTLRLTQADNYHVAAINCDAPPLGLKQFVSVAGRLFALDKAGGLFEMLLTSGQPLSEATAAQDNAVQFRSMPLAASGLLMSVAMLPQPSLVVAFDNQTLVRLALDDATVLAQWPLPSQPQQIHVSSDGEVLLAIGEDGAARLHKLASGELLAALDRDYVQTAKLREGQRSNKRQQAHVDQLVGQLPELQKASEAEIEAHKKVQETREQAVAALATKDTELATAQTSRGETEQALAAAQQRVVELTAELEAKVKAAEEAQAKRAAAATELTEREQALATAADGVQRAAERIVALQTLTENERLRLADIQARTQELEASVATPPAVTGQFSGDGAAVIIAGSDHVVRLYSATTGEPRAALTGATAKLLSLHALENNELRGLTVDGRILSWNTNLAWLLERTLGSPSESLFSDRICALDFSPDGHTLAVGSGPPSRFGDIKLIDVSSGQISRDFGEVHSDTVLGLRFSPDGRMLASGGADKLCRLWDIATGQAIRSFEGHTHHVLSIAWQDSGGRLATASADQSVKIWNVDSGEQQRTIGGFSHEVTAIEFVGDTTQLIAVAADGSARVLNTDDGGTLRALAGAENALYCLSTSADDQRVMAGGQAGRVWTWLIADGKLLE